MESQKKYKPTFSFEFYPPKTPEAVAKLQTTQVELAKLNPNFFSVTFGAGGSTRDMTFETVMDIKEKTGIEAAPHLSCIGSQADEIKAILDKYIESGITRIVALRGDLPSGSVGYGEFRYANELVDFIRKETGDHFEIEVACYPEFHPQAKNAQTDIENFKRKIDAGANGAITQYFYNPFAYYRFIDSCEKLGIETPIIAGVMPIVTCTQLQRFSDACGAEIPRWILKRLQEFGDDRVSIREFGIDVTTELCEQLLANGAPGIHFYSMNLSAACVAIWKNLGIDQ
ncbi:MAG TPA: methylenetetrahydrofolate reductase [NAD(P)H] [Thiotrichaceae bacterium]|jgi:methylenetetrahydrofolate reductase (NADPH)|nr:methylenetetrahydrofolate reductase [NAD(P)H] [Thiotrichaceae bacterium]HIM08527.1 methylenetetrahydrofolate reductase [NAD(P)H] [Gammaproteobacteria bacterium]